MELAGRSHAHMISSRGDEGPLSHPSEKQGCDVSPPPINASGVHPVPTLGSTTSALLAQLDHDAQADVLEALGWLHRAFEG